jgi:hypothetical protein
MRSRRRNPRLWVAILLIGTAILGCSVLAAAQTPYKPKFPGDPARSESEAGALGYMRTVIRAQKVYNRKNGSYATTLMQLVHTGSFTRRMVQADRGDYKVGFRSHKDGYELTLTPKQLDSDHRSFYANEDGIIHADDQKAADENSPKVK